MAGMKAPTTDQMWLLGGAAGLLGLFALAGWMGNKDEVKGFDGVGAIGGAGYTRRAAQKFTDLVNSKSLVQRETNQPLDAQATLNRLTRPLRYEVRVRGAHHQGVKGWTAHFAFPDPKHKTAVYQKAHTWGTAYVFTPGPLDQADKGRLGLTTLWIPEWATTSGLVEVGRFGRWKRRRRWGRRHGVIGRGRMRRRLGRRRRRRLGWRRRRRLGARGRGTGIYRRIARQEGYPTWRAMRRHKIATLGPRGWRQWKRQKAAQYGIGGGGYQGGGGGYQDDFGGGGYQDDFGGGGYQDDFGGGEGAYGYEGQFQDGAMQQGGY